MRWAGHVARLGGKRNVYRRLVGKPEGVDNLKIDLREMRWDDVDCIDLAQARDQWRALLYTVMNFRVS
jgi:hypothetical protein